MQDLIKIGEYDVTSIFTLIFGALISALFAYIFSYRREKRFLKLRIQVETAEALLKIINDYESKNYSPLWNYNGLYIDLHNSFIEQHPVNAQFFNESIFQRNITSINNEFIKFGECYAACSESLLQITRFIESHQIVLNKLVNFIVVS